MFNQCNIRSPFTGRMLTICVMLMAMLATGPAMAQTTDEAKPDKGPPTLRFRLLDGSIVSGTLALDSLEVKTAFGTLTVPIKAIRSFTPGLDSRPKVSEQIDKLVSQLGDMDAAKRDAAQSELLAMGTRVRRQLEQRANDDDPERRLRISKILEEMQELEEDDMMSSDSSSEIVLRKLDVVVTDEFTIAGDVNPKEFRIASQYGTLTVKLSDIDNAEIDGPDQSRDIREKVVVSGNNLTCIQYKQTGIQVRRGDSVNIKASGQIVLTPWGSNSVSGPDGAPNNGWYIQNDIPFGALTAKIGDDGPEFKVGSSSQFTAKKSGILYMGVAMQSNYARQGFPGQYEVRVSVRGK